MKLSFVKANPTDNMTVFVLDPVPRQLHSNVAQKILDYGNLYAEQVGFIESPNPQNINAHMRLQMMGGEFCGNATRALAAVLVDRRYPGIEKVNGVWEVLLEVSGTDLLIPCKVEESEESSYHVSASMPLPLDISEIHIKDNNDEIQAGTLVRYTGISHIIFHSEKTEVSKEFIESIRVLLPDLKNDALGIMLYNPSNRFMTPIVHVPETNSVIYEHGCGSGSAALASVISMKNRKNMDVEINQPGGKLYVSTNYDNSILKESILKGRVQIVAEGQVTV